jgi:small subunit ribosomal protein S2
MKEAEAKRKEFNMAVVPMKALLESGVHFGHRTHRWHPRMKPYIFTERNGIHIINLQLTSKALTDAYNLIRDTVAEGGVVLFVGTKRQAQETIEEEAIRCGMPFVTIRWLGGMLTNFRTIRNRINELDMLERRRDTGEFERLTKKEALMLNREIEKLDMRFSGSRHMVNLPDLVFVVDVRREETAIHEANLLNIPVIGMVDTNCDPTDIDYVIPSNDDAIRAIKLIVGKVADAVIEGKGMRKEEDVEEERQVRVRIESSEDELSDEELLGAATLAKLRSVGEEEVEGDEVAVEAAEKVVAETLELDAESVGWEAAGAAESEVEAVEAEMEATVEEAVAEEAELPETEAAEAETEAMMEEAVAEEAELPEAEAGEDLPEDLEETEIDELEDGKEEDE